MLQRQWTMLDWFRDQERRLDAWRDEAATRGAAPEELDRLSHQREWLSGQVRRLAALAPTSLEQPVAMQPAFGRLRRGY